MRHVHASSSTMRTPEQLAVAKVKDWHQRHTRLHRQPHKAFAVAHLAGGPAVSQLVVHPSELWDDGRHLSVDRRPRLVRLLN